MKGGRRRTISRRDFDDPRVGDLLPWIRDVRHSLIVLADDYGHVPAEPRWIIAHAYARLQPHEQPNIPAALEELARRGLVTVYRDSRGERYVELDGWDDEQKVDRPGTARYPGPEEAGGMVADVWSQWLAAYREAYGDDYIEEGSDRKQLGNFLRRLPRREIADQLPEVFRAYLRDRSDRYIVACTHPLTWFLTRGFNRYRDRVRKERERERSTRAAQQSEQRLEPAKRRAPDWFVGTPVAR